jgi:hypothetical protein
MSENGIVKKQTSSVEHFNPDDSASLFMQTSLFEQVQRAAMMLSRSNLVPAHLRGDDKVADCFLVIEQAMRWRMSPFAVAQSTYVLSGTLGYAGKLIAAVVNASPRLEKSLSYSYSGKPGTRDRAVKVSGTLKGETTPREVDGSVEQWATTQWKAADFDQRLAYRGAREWARRHMPEVILGVYAEEEVEQIATRPTVTTVTPESLDDFLAPTSVTTTDEGQKSKVLDAEVTKPQPKTTTVIDVGEAVKKEAAAALVKKSAKDKEVEDLFG